MMTKVSFAVTVYIGCRRRVLVCLPQWIVETLSTTARARLTSHLRILQYGTTPRTQYNKSTCRFASRGKYAIGFRLYVSLLAFSFFFFQAEDGIRDVAVTGVQTCALPISREARCSPGSSTAPPPEAMAPPATPPPMPTPPPPCAPCRPRCASSTAPSGSPAKIGRASCRERV